MDNYARTTGVNQYCYGQTGPYGLPSHWPFPICNFFPFVILYIAILSTAISMLMIPKFSSNFYLEFLICISSPMPNTSSTGPTVMSHSSWIQPPFITESSLLVFSWSQPSSLLSYNLEFIPHPELIPLPHCLHRSPNLFNFITAIVSKYNPTSYCHCLFCIRDLMNLFSGLLSGFLSVHSVSRPSLLRSASILLLERKHKPDLVIHLLKGLCWYYLANPLNHSIQGRPNLVLSSCWSSHLFFFFFFNYFIYF